MRYLRLFILTQLPLLLLPLLAPAQGASPAPFDWPEADSDARIWTRWWWHGSAVDEAGITSELEALRDAGFGGVELTPIFGVIGEEEDFVEYLSPRWVVLLEHTLSEVARLGMQADMATGTGWPFGGPWVTSEDASKYLAHTVYELSGGERLTEPITYTQEPILRRITNGALALYRAAEASGREMAELDTAAVLRDARSVTLDDLNRDIGANQDLQGLALDQVRFSEALPLVSLMAYPEKGEPKELTDRVGPDGRLDWTAPAGKWTLYALFEGLHGKMVERAAPGGEGNVIDHFSTPAIRHYLARFDTAFAGHVTGGLRAYFNDSYEVDDASGQANWTPEFFQGFRDKRGYDLRQHLPELFDTTASEQHVRVLSDVRETFSELLLETFTREWGSWATERGARIRNQAHGSPASILDLYAASDIPETEGTEPLRIKFATSAAHVTGKPLVSAEAATWLGEHFVSDWSDLKRNLDGYLVNGVNHLVYHGNAYSPAGDDYPGRLFYAAFHANRRHSMWEDLGAVNTYVGRVQSLLQESETDNDILLYFPIYDRFAMPGRELLQHFDGHGAALDTTAVAQIGEELLADGYTFDFISDRQLAATEYADGIRTEGGATYRTVVVPATRYMPEATLKALLDLARGGATVIMEGGLPASVPGLHDRAAREARLKKLLGELSGATETSAVGKGRVIVTDDLHATLAEMDIQSEKMVTHGLTFARQRYRDGRLYVVTNWSDDDVDGWVPLTAAGEAAVLYDPMTGRRGLARTRTTADGGLELRMELDRGATALVWVTPTALTDAPWPYMDGSGPETALAGPWSLTFVTGGAELPGDVALPQPEPWTSQEGDAYRFFSGTGSYQTTFARPVGDAPGYTLDLGEVYSSARVYLNDELVATLIGPTYRVYLPTDRLRESNQLRVEVSNRMINRIIKLDRDRVFWKKFYNTNFPPRLRENTGPLGIFDAAHWEPVPAGLAGPVTLIASRAESEE